MHISAISQFIILGTGINLMEDAKIDTSTGGSSVSSVTNGVVFLGSPKPHSAAGTHLSRFSPSEVLVRVTLKQECLVNMIELDGVPNIYLLRPPIDEGEVGLRNI